jgi:hypothetical protein
MIKMISCGLYYLWIFHNILQIQHLCHWNKA